MLPVLLDLHFIKIYTFGVFAVLAFFWGSFVLWKMIRLTAHKEDEVFDGVFFSFIGALFFGRLAYVSFHWKEFGPSILKFILINGYPGMSLYGALLGGFIFAWFYFSGKKINFREISDYFISPLFLALAIGKLGGFFSGGEPGAPARFFLTVHYLGFAGARHITALYESLLFFLASFISYKWVLEIRKEKLAHGFLFIFFIWYMALVYFLFDKLKSNHLYFLDQSVNEVVSAVLLLTTSAYFLYYFRGFIFNQLQIVFKNLDTYGSQTHAGIAKKIRERTSETKK